MVYSGFRSLSPAGLLIKSVELGDDRILITARCRSAAGTCPECGRSSEHVHSRYERKLLDLPSHGRAVQLRIVVRRFRCMEPSCGRHIFAELLGDAITSRSARRTSRLEKIVHHLGVALGGRPAAALARRLMLPVSKDTLLRVVRRRTARDTSPLHVIGIDDWAWKRGQRYGSIICDLEQRRIVDLLPDREPATVEAWLSRHPEIACTTPDEVLGTHSPPRQATSVDQHLNRHAGEFDGRNRSTSVRAATPGRRAPGSYGPLPGLGCHHSPAASCATR